MESRQFRLRKIKSQIRLFLPVALMVFSLCLIGFGRFQNPLLNQFKMAVQETVSPIVYVVCTPIRWGKSAFHSAVSFWDTYRENEALKIENEKLKNWRNIALQLSVEQEELKKLLLYTPPRQSASHTAKVLSDNGNRFAKSLLVSAGREQGIQKGDIAMTSNGVYGRIVEVGQQVSRLMLLTDYASRVPVSVGSNQVTCIMSGDGSSSPKLTSLPEGAEILVGDVVLTSGQVGVYPTGLGIGVVETVADGEIRVRLFENEQTPVFVRLVNFNLSDVLLKDDVASSEGL